jgi:hypothetical protein
MRNRCTEASGLCRSRRTVNAKVKCSSTAQLRFPDALRDPLTPHQSFPSSALTPCSTPPSTWTSAHDHPRKHLHQYFLTSLTPHTSPFRSPIALSSYHPNPTHDSSAPRRGVEGGAAQLFSVGGQGRGAIRARSGRPAGGHRSRGCPDTGHAGRRPVRVLCPPCGRPSNRSSGRPVSTRPVSHASGAIQVSGRTGLWCPRLCSRAVRTALALEWLGAAGSPRWAQWVRRAAVVHGRRGRPPAYGLDGKGWCCVGRGWLARGSPDLGRRIARTGCGAAPPPGDKGAGPAPGCRSVGWGARERAGAHLSSRRWVLGRLPAWPDHGAGQGAVTTLRGRWAGDGPVSSVPEGHPVRPGSRLRPQRGRGRDERCPSRADSDLTSDNSGGRDRV